MFDSIRNYLGLKTPNKKTTFITIRNSLLIVAAFGVFILTPTFLVHVDQANQLLQMQTTIEEGFQKIETTAENLKSNRNPENLEQEAEQRLGLTIKELQKNENSDIESQTENNSTEEPTE
jgi:hypothetical protein